MKTILHKTCGCVSKASGPRYIISEGQPVGPWEPFNGGVHLYPKKYVFQVQYVPMACDNCNSPWIVVDKEHRGEAKAELEKMGKIQQLREDLSSHLKDIRKVKRDFEEALDKMAEERENE